MKPVTALIIALQFSTFGYAQIDAAAMPGSLKNYTVDKSSDTSSIPVDSGIIKAKAISPWFVERFKITAGFYEAINNTHVRVGNNSGNEGTDIDLEDDLGLKKNVACFITDLQWRASRRSRFDLSYYNIDRNSIYTLKKDISFGDHTYPADSTVKCFFNTKIYRFSYGYAIFAKPKFELGVLLGVHIVRAGVGLGTYTTNESITVSDDFDFTAPLPDLGLWGGYAFSKRFAVNGEVDYLSLTVGDISGRILAYNVIFMYKLSAPLDLSLGYTGLNFKVEATKTNQNGHLKWSYNGPSITAAFTFGNKKWAHE